MQKEDEERFDKLRDEARELYAQTVEDVSDRFPQDNPEEVTSVWNKVLERLYSNLAHILEDKVDFEGYIEIIRVVFAIEIGSGVSFNQKEKATAWKHLDKAIHDGLNNDEKVFRLIWCLSPYVGYELGSEKVSDAETGYIRLLGKEGDLGVRSIARIMKRSTETIHRILKG